MIPHQQSSFESIYFIKDKQAYITCMAKPLLQFYNQNSTRS